MKNIFTSLYGIGLATTVTLVISACSSNPEKAATDTKVYYATMNDSIAMAAVFKSTIMDTTYLGAGPNAGQVDEVKTRWAWKASNLDSLKVRYPEAQTEGSTSEPIVIYYSLVDNALATKEKEKYELNYTAELPFFQQDKVTLGENEGIATFLKNEKGWYLMNNIYNTLALEQRESVAKAAKESANERLVTLKWRNQTSLAASQLCASQAYKNLTFSGSNILEVPRGQTWVPVAGDSYPEEGSNLSANIKIEADDDRNHLPCYFGTVRELPNNRSKSIVRAKDEFHKYYEGTKVRFWGQGKFSEVTLLIIGPGPIPSGATTAKKPGAVPSYAPTPAPVQESRISNNSTEGYNPEIYGLFVDAGETKEFTGKVGNLAAVYSLELDNRQVINGTYYYPNKPTKEYTLEGKLNENGTMNLVEYDGEKQTATCTLKLSGNCYTGRMQNADGRSFPMSICR